MHSHAAGGFPEGSTISHYKALEKRRFGRNPTFKLTYLVEKGNILAFQHTKFMALSLTTLTTAFSRFRSTPAVMGFQSTMVLVLQLPEFSDLYNQKKGNVYNILWVLVFGFATLNILGLVLRRFEPRRSGLNFGEILAIVVVFLSVFLLALELLNLFHIFPIKLNPR
ncbi:MAG: hypothetical protein WB952_19335 [Terriglobales bacterium]